MTELPDDLTLEQPRFLLRERVLDRLRQAILAGRYHPGQRLLERDLCAALGVSRTSIREALRQLEIERLVEVGPRGRPFVATLTAEKARHIYEFREVLETAAVELFIARAPKSAHAELVALASRFRSALNVGDLADRLEIKGRFYDILFEGAGNPTMHRAFKQLFNRIGFLRFRSLGEQTPGASRAEELEEVIACLNARDVKGAREAIRQHVNHVSAAAISWLEKRETEAD